MRARGERGLGEWLAAHPVTGPSPMLDAICAQRDAHAALLYWAHRFRHRARRGRGERPAHPVLAGGRLDEALSCANSRFFRASLYANFAASQYLRARVLHRHTVRPAPRVTIDFGERRGRILTPTLTGNSAHYLLDARGRPIDVLPGLYSPAAFLRALEAAEAPARATARLDGGERRAWLGRWHAGRAAAILAEWRAALGDLRLAPRSRDAAALEAASDWPRLASLRLDEALPDREPPRD